MNKTQTFGKRKKVYMRIAGYIERHDIAGAWKVLEGGKLVGATKLDIASLKASLHEAQGQEKAAERILRGAALQFPRDITPWVELVELHRDNEERPKAYRLLRRLWREVEAGRYRGNRQRLNERLVELEASTAESARERREAISVIARALSRFPQSNSIRQWLKMLIE